MRTYADDAASLSPSLNGTMPVCGAIPEFSASPFYIATGKFMPDGGLTVATAVLRAIDIPGPAVEGISAVPIEAGDIRGGGALNGTRPVPSEPGEIVAALFKNY